MLGLRRFATLGFFLLFGLRVLAAEDRQFIFYSASNDTSIVSVYDDSTRLMHFERCVLGQGSGDLKVSEAYAKIADGSAACIRLNDSVQLTDDSERERFNYILNNNITKSAGPIVADTPSTFNNGLRKAQYLVGTAGILAGAVRYSLHLHSNRFADAVGLERTASARTLRMASVSSWIAVIAVVSVAAIEGYFALDAHMKETSIGEIVPVNPAQRNAVSRAPIELTENQLKLITPK